MRRIGCVPVWTHTEKTFPEDARDEPMISEIAEQGKTALMIQVIKSLVTESGLFVINISEERRNAKWYMET